MKYGIVKETWVRNGDDTDFELEVLKDFDLLEEAEKYSSSSEFLKEKNRNERGVRKFGGYVMSKAYRIVFHNEKYNIYSIGSQSKTIKEIK